MTSEIILIPNLIGTNYLVWKRKLINILKAKNLWRIINGARKKPTNAKYFVVWEKDCKHARGLIGQTILYNLQIYIATKDNLIEVWKTLTYLHEKTSDVTTHSQRMKGFDMLRKEVLTLQSIVSQWQTKQEGLRIQYQILKKDHDSLLM